MKTHSEIHSTVNGHGRNGNGHHRRRPQFHGELRLAALRAHAGAMLVREKGFTIAGAAMMAGSNGHYVGALLTILASENEALLYDVLSGRVPVLQAAAQVKEVANLSTAFETASETNKIAWARSVGVERLFNDVLIPASTAISAK